MATWPAKTNYATGDVLTAAQMNDIGGELNDLYTVAGKAAGVNAILNGDFGIWQRGTSFTGASGAFFADRWLVSYADANPTSATLSQQTFTAGTAPVAGYEGTFFGRSTITTAGSCTTYNAFTQKIENVRTFAGQTVTLSFWAKSDSNRNQTVFLTQDFGSGGSAAVNLSAQTISTTTSWQRFTLNFSLPSISGKTIGTGNNVQVIIRQAVANGSVLDIWGVQLEAGSVATSFQTATGTIQGELAACQRYYWRFTGGNGNFAAYGTGVTGSTTQSDVFVQFPTSMRTRPTTVEYSTLALGDGANTPAAVTSLTVLRSNELGATLAAGATGLTQYRPYQLLNNSNSTTAYLGVSAEL